MRPFLACACFEFDPLAIGLEQQRYVIGMFEIGLANDSRLPVRTTPTVRHRMLIDSKDARATLRQSTDYRTSHPPAADDDLGYLPRFS